MAKYVCKSVAEFGLAPQRISPMAIEALNVREHIRAILCTLRDLAGLPGYGPMLAWLHTLGYRGHVASRSQRFSTTMAALRARRAAWHRQHPGAAEPTRSCGDGSDDNRVIGWRLQQRGVPVNIGLSPASSTPT
ncbi:replication initiator [Mycobacterium sp.]|uniref:replication initiator n=1 Tax=Mycobacterium sp. TaxID=1785 RepID=UPI00345C4B86